MPVFDIGDVLENLSNRFQGLSPQRYSFLSSLCAATTLHLNFEGTETSSKRLEDALWARNQYDTIGDRSLDTLLSSFFLSIAYWCLDREKYAGFYLQETIALALARNMHREDHYQDLSVADSEYHRRIFWTLFTTERTFCLIYDKPMILRPWIRKPQNRIPGERYLIDGFVQVLGMIENLSIEQTTWTASGCVTPLSLKESLGENISNIWESESICPIQKFEALITGQWLQAKLWKLIAKPSPTPFYAAKDARQRPHPLVIGRAVLHILETFKPISRGCHGIALDRKLYDICECLCDVAPELQQFGTEFKELGRVVSGLLRVLSEFKGCTPHVLSNIQKLAQKLFL
ncbi:hypothetical protein FQN54_004695 [Arachnomyces sp. PD_36]|nr:hypothetical protein FQN54_004695 [Arachnomyces sp. PD_36]